MEENIFIELRDKQETSAQIHGLLTFILVPPVLGSRTFSMKYKETWLYYRLLKKLIEWDFWSLGLLLEEFGHERFLLIS